MNYAVLMGRLTAAPELKKTPNDISVVSFTLAVDKAFGGDNGQREADFIPCVAWRNTAEFVAKWFGKGAMIAVEGRLQSRKYQDKAGNNRTAIELVVDRAHFTGEKAKDSNRGYPADVDGFVEYDDDGDIPF